MLGAGLIYSKIILGAHCSLLSSSCFSVTTVTSTLKRELSPSLPNNRVGQILHITGTALVAVSVLLLLVTFSPVIREEIKYQLWPIHSDALVLSDTEAKP